MHPRVRVPLALTSLLRAQHGVFTRQQVRTMGLGIRSLRRLLDTDQWQRLGYGVYSVGVPLEPLQRAWAAHLMAGEGSVLGAGAALALRGIAELPPGELVAWVGTAEQKRGRPGWVRVRRDSEGRISRRRGLLPLISVEDALLDSGADLAARELEGVVTAALRLRRTTVAALAGALESRDRVSQRTVFAELLGAGPGLESVLELRYQRDVERHHGLPSGTRQRSHSAGTRSDVTYDDYLVVVELDGRLGHGDRFRDMWRDNVHATRAILTLRYGWDDVRGRPCEVAAQVGMVLRQRGWSGSPRPCRHCLVASVQQD